jgi:hypothetical protein
MNSILGLLKKIGHFFVSDRAQKLVREVGEILPVALTVVKHITSLTPTRVDDEVVKAFEMFGVPLVAGYPQNPELALRELASAVVKEKVPTAAQSVVNAAIELAVVAGKK